MYILESCVEYIFIVSVPRPLPLLEICRDQHQDLVWLTGPMGPPVLRYPPLLGAPYDILNEWRDGNMNTFSLLRLWAARNAKHKTILAHSQKNHSRAVSAPQFIPFSLSEGLAGPET